MKNLFRFLWLFRNPLVAILDRLALIKSPLVDHRLRNGLTFWCRPGSSDLMSVWDIFSSQHHSAYLSEFQIHPGDKVIDFGANIGVFSIQCAQTPDVEVWAYEPLCDTYNTMRANIAQNGMSQRIHAFPLAIAREAGTQELYLGNRNHSMSCSFYPHENSSGDAVRIQTVPFVMILEEHDFIDLLKIDCEGAEFDFLPSATAEQMAHVDRIVLEYHELQPGWDHQDLARLFREWGFEVKIKPWKPKYGIIYAWRFK